MPDAKLIQSILTRSSDADDARSSMPIRHYTVDAALPKTGATQPWL